MQEQDASIIWGNEDISDVTAKKESEVTAEENTPCRPEDHVVRAELFQPPGTGAQKVHSLRLKPKEGEEPKGERELSVYFGERASAMWSGVELGRSYDILLSMKPFKIPTVQDQSFRACELRFTYDKGANTHFMEPSSGNKVVACNDHLYGILYKILGCTHQEAMAYLNRMRDGETITMYYAFST
jgi:hypothetical protein